MSAGRQASGGNFTGVIIGDIADIGYPFIDIDGDGVFTVSKPEGTGGVVNVGRIGANAL